MYQKLYREQKQERTWASEGESLFSRITCRNCYFYLEKIKKRVKGALNIKLNLKSYIPKIPWRWGRPASRNLTCVSSSPNFNRRNQEICLLVLGVTKYDTWYIIEEVWRSYSPSKKQPKYYGSANARLCAILNPGS